MNVTLDLDLWLVEEPRGTFTLMPPLARDSITGRNYPGFFNPRPTILKAGTRLEIRLLVDDCAGCQKYAEHVKGFVHGGTLDGKPLYLEHTHGVL